MCIVLFEPFKAVVLCRVVYRDNSKVDRCGVSVVLLWGCCGVVDGLVFGFGVVDRLRGWESEKTLKRALPSAKRSFFNRILAVKHTLTIQFPVYSSVMTVYYTEPEKIG